MGKSLFKLCKYDFVVFYVNLFSPYQFLCCLGFSFLSLCLFSKSRLEELKTLVRIFQFTAY